FITFFREGVVLRVPTAILSTGLMVLAFISVVAGLMLDTVTRGRREMKRLVYLQQRAPDEGRDRGEEEVSPNGKPHQRKYLFLFPSPPAPNHFFFAVHIFEL